MKKTISKIIMVLFILTTCVSLAPQAKAAYTRIVTKEYQCDYNTFTKKDMNIITLKSIKVADDARLHYSDRLQIGEGWNYIRYKVTNYWKNADHNW